MMKRMHEVNTRAPSRSNPCMRKYHPILPSLAFFVRVSCTAPAELAATKKLGSKLMLKNLPWPFLPPENFASGTARGHRLPSQSLFFQLTTG